MKQFPLLLVLVVSAVAQVPTDTSTTTSNPVAAAKIASAYLAFANGKSLYDIHLEGVVSEQGTQGTFVYDVTGVGRSKLQLNLGERTRTEIASGYGEQPNCSWTDAKGTSSAVATHNCLTSVPELLPLASAQPAQIALAYKLSGDSRALTSVRKHAQDDKDTNATLESLSEASLVIDEKTQLPAKLTYSTHPDNDFSTSIPVEVTYSDYREMNGINIPGSIKKSVNGTTVLEFTVTSAQINTGTEAK
jgi:hypothetical protein